MRKHIIIGLWLLLIVGLLYAAYWIVPGLISYRDVMAISTEGVPAQVANATLQATVNRGLPGIVVAVVGAIGLVGVLLDARRRRV